MTSHGNSRQSHDRDMKKPCLETVSRQHTCLETPPLESSYQVVKLRQRCWDLLLVVVRSTVVRDPLLQRNGGDYDVQVK